MSKKRMFGILVTGAMLCLIASASPAADKSTPVGILGVYTIDGATKDNMTATLNNAPLKPESGSGDPDDPQDIIVVFEITNNAVVFTGRSAENGCFYRTWGTFALSTGRFTGRLYQKPPWEAWFNDDSDARVVLTLNEGGTGDDYVAYGDSGATLTVRVLGGSSTTDYDVKLEDAPEGTPEGNITFSEEKEDEHVVTVKGQGGMATVQVNGVALGKVNITGSCETAIDSEVVRAEVIPGVVLVSVNAAVPSTTVINYRTNPTGATLTSVAFAAPGTTASKANVTGNFNFTYNQANLPYRTSDITVTYSTRKTHCSTVMTRKCKDASEILFVWFAGVGMRPYNHGGSEIYGSITYPVTYTGQTIWTTSSTASLTLPQADWGSVYGWSENHKYTWAAGASAWAPMGAPLGGWIGLQLTMYKNVATPLWIVPGATVEGIVGATTLWYQTGDGGALGVITNAETNIAMPQ